MPTFGKTSNGTSSNTSTADTVMVSVATPTESGRIQSLSARVWTTGGTTNTRGVIYSDLNGVPDTLIAYTDVLAVTNTVEQLQTLAFAGDNQQFVAANTPYWIGLHCSDPGAFNTTVSKQATTNQAYTKAATFTNGPPSILGATLTATTGPLDVYVTYDSAPLGYATLSSVINDKIAGTSSVRAENVFDYAKPILGGYPAVTITAADGGGEFADSTRTRRRFVFSIKVMVNRLNQESKAERVMRETVDELIAMFEADPYLNNCLRGRGFARPVPSRWGYNQSDNIDIRMAEFLLDVEVIQ